MLRRLRSLAGPRRDRFTVVLAAQSMTRCRPRSSRRHRLGAAEDRRRFAPRARACGARRARTLEDDRAALSSRPSRGASRILRSGRPVHEQTDDWSGPSTQPWAGWWVLAIGARVAASTGRAPGPRSWPALYAVAVFSVFARRPGEMAARVRTDLGRVAEAECSTPIIRLLIVAFEVFEWRCRPAASSAPGGARLPASAPAGRASTTRTRSASKGGVLAERDTSARAAAVTAGWSRWLDCACRRRTASAVGIWPGCFANHRARAADTGRVREHGLKGETETRILDG